ncbi:MAG: aspartate kinase [Wenzhouxiangella sp.]|jgi:aspartate kinase|nr:aspartate kinase [Wenzhouxiangella sp.]
MMNTIVQKFGGSSLAEDAQLRAVAERVARTWRQGHPVVVVVSARGDTTSKLLASAGRFNTQPDHRELDMLLAAGEQTSASLLSLALQDLDVPACSMTGPQAGVRTCSAHLNARIKAVEPGRILKALGEGKVVVVAGFQGASPDGDITTLGRGGSDTTAVAIAAAVRAERCEIYSDVDGVYTADPRLVPEAIRLRALSLAEMKTLAHHGAGVLNERAIDYALEHGVIIHARKSHGEGGQTVVRKKADGGASRIVGIAAHKNLVSIQFDETADRQCLAEVLGEYEGFAPELAGKDSGCYLLPIDQLADVNGLAAALQHSFGDAVEIAYPLASVSAVGFGAGEDGDILRLAAKNLTDAGIEVYQSFALAHAVTCMVAADQVAKASQALHAGFGINSTEVADVA